MPGSLEAAIRFAILALTLLASACVSVKVETGNKFAPAATRSSTRLSGGRFPPNPSQPAHRHTSQRDERSTAPSRKRPSVLRIPIRPTTLRRSLQRSSWISTRRSWTTAVFQGELIRLGDTEYSEKIWDHWIALRDAGPVPGAVAFVNYARLQHDDEGRPVRVFFVTNRNAEVARTGRAIAPSKKTPPKT